MAIVGSLIARRISDCSRATGNSSEPPLKCPITAYGGFSDDSVKHCDLSRDGAIRPARPSSLRMFPGDHFFLRTSDHCSLERSPRSCDEGTPVNTTAASVDSLWCPPAEHVTLDRCAVPCGAPLGPETLSSKSLPTTLSQLMNNQEPIGSTFVRDPRPLYRAEGY